MQSAKRRLIDANSMLYAKEWPRSISIAVTDPVKNKTPESITGIQNDLPTSKCLILRRVFHDNMDKTMAIPASGTSRKSTMVFSS